MRENCTYGLMREAVVTPLLYSVTSEGLISKVLQVLVSFTSVFICSLRLRFERFFFRGCRGGERFRVKV